MSRNMSGQASSLSDSPFILPAQQDDFALLQGTVTGPLADARREVNRFYRLDEVDVVKCLLAATDLQEPSRQRIKTQARTWVENIRQSRALKTNVDELLNEFSLSTDEGVSLMCLAEALLRVPDSYTMDRLIRDKLAKGNWSSHLGKRDSLFVNASAWGLLLTGKLTDYSIQEEKRRTAEEEKQRAALEEQRRAAQDGQKQAVSTVHQNNSEPRRTPLQHALMSVLGRLGEPVIRAALRTAMRMMGTHFVMGKTMAEAMEKSQKGDLKAYRFSYDMLGEGARTQADADRYWKRYRDAIEALGQQQAAADGATATTATTATASDDESNSTVTRAGISIKLSALHPRYDYAHRAAVLAELVPKIKQLVIQAKAYDIGLTIDAEEAHRLDLSLDIVERVFSDPELGDWQGFGLAIQAYQKRALALIDWVRVLAQQAQRKIVVRLVKGAYWDTEIKKTQEAGCSDYPVFTRKAATDVSYQACVQKLLSYRDDIYPQFATHNAYTVATILEMDRLMADAAVAEAGASARPLCRRGYEFQRLYGMGELLYEQVMDSEKVPCRVYAPVGEQADLLAYLVRRLLENGANSSFVNRLLKNDISVAVLLEDPLDALAARPDLRHPDIPLPENLFLQGEKPHRRKNSRGIDLSDRQESYRLQTELQHWWQQTKATTLSVDSAPDSWLIYNPAYPEELVGRVSPDDGADLVEKLERAQQAFERWSQAPVNARADSVRRLADALEHHRAELVGLCVKEAGKTIEDGLAEVREAVDFCRYYANQAEALMSRKDVTSRGVMLCISPWNFPLAIFLGQVSAALLTGNTVLAKPARQANLMALRVRELMTECGIPEDCVQLLLAPGRVVGEQLLPDQRIQGVLFTGSTETGQQLAQVLADRADIGIPLMAETAGQNAMIVDSTALPEQVTDDVIRSAFHSAGQRCSALRILFLQEDIADSLLTMLSGAMQELVIGDPALLATDIGPVIDANARTKLQAHCDYLDSLTPQQQLLEPSTVQTGLSVHAGAKSWAKLLYRCPLPAGLEGSFFAPHLYEISDLSVLAEETFGPVVHVIRYAAEDLDKVIEQINKLGYGLTLGLHSRIDATAERIIQRAKVGNIYVNRNMIGAVVGAQPFGGRGLSGTGPKAGGPQYLKRLVHFTAADLNSGAEGFSKYRSHSRSDGELGAVCVEDLTVAPRLLAFRESMRLWQRQSDDWVQSLLSEALPELRQLNELVSCGYLNPQTLPGPAGEFNQLRLEPKGQVAIVVGEKGCVKEAVISAMAALLVGCEITILTDAVHQSRFELLMSCWANPRISEESPEVCLPKIHLETLSDLQTVCVNPNTQAVMVVGSHDMEKSLQRWLVRRGAGLVSLIGCEPVKQRLLRLTVEKTITINTSAVGGDPSLMALS